jgi:hypothetical protein
MADLERRLSEEEHDIEKGALTDWEVQYARAKLELKEKHYKVGGNTPGPNWNSRRNTTR